MKTNKSVSHTMLITSLERARSSMWELETLGIRPDVESTDVLARFQESVRFRGPRYEVQLPWRADHDLLADNFKISKTRLLSLLVKLRKEPDLIEADGEVMSEQIRNGVLENVIQDHAPEIGSVYYMPYHALIMKEKETKKLRVVYDASSKTVCPSMNDVLQEGPCLLPELIKVLLRFRSFKVVVIADIGKAFLQVEIAKQDRNFLRILWVKDLIA